MAILLIRHGETDANAARVLQTPGVPLSARGRDQARRLARRLADDGVESILSSDLERAAETARAIAEATGASIRLEPLLQERNFGDLRGTPYSELASDPFAPGYAPPGGETWEVFHERVEQAWQQVARHAEEATGHLAVVTHGLVCRTVLERWAGWPGEERAMPPLANTCLSILDPRPPHRLQRVAGTEHLGDEGGSGRGGIA